MTNERTGLVDTARVLRLYFILLAAIGLLAVAIAYLLPRGLEAPEAQMLLPLLVAVAGLVCAAAPYTLLERRGSRGAALLVIGITLLVLVTLFALANLWGLIVFAILCPVAIHTLIRNLRGNNAR